MPELKDLTVNFISLVAKPANGKPLVLKSQGKPTVFALEKMDDALMRAYGIVYSPDQTDSQGDFATADTIRQAATRFMRQKNQDNVDKEHSYSEEAAFVAETWLVRSQDPLFPGEPDGAWAVGIQINDADLWKQLKSGELAGLSLAGYAKVVDPNEPVNIGKDAEGLLAGLLNKLLGKSHNDATNNDGERAGDMTKEEIAALVANEVEKALAKTNKEKAAGDCNGKCLADGACPHGLTPPPASQKKSAEAGEGDDPASAGIAKMIADLEARLDEKIAKSFTKGGMDGGSGDETRDTFL